MTKKSRQQRSEEMRAEAMAKVANRAEQTLNDDRYRWLRSKTGSRTIVATTLISIVCYTAFSIAEMPVLALLSIVAYGIHMWLLRTATRNVTDWPDEFLDERLQSLRNLMYRYAYMLVVGLFAIFLIAVPLIDAFTPFTVGAEEMVEAGFGLFFLAIVAPAMVYAWMKSDV